MVSSAYKPKDSGIRNTLFEVIFEADTPAGKAFDVVLLFLILFSILVVTLESVADLQARYGELFRIIEWGVTAVFTLEYLLRIYCCAAPRKYIFSFFGLIDLFSVLPTYIGLFFVGTHYLVVIRTIRLLRVFRVLKMTRYMGEANVLMAALRASQPKITVFLGTVVSIVVIVGALMHLIEGPENGFTSIPRSMYWAVVTLTTVGYGNVAPQTVLGQGVAAMLMIFGYGIIAVPTGIVSAELTRAKAGDTSRKCAACKHVEDDSQAKFCRKCGQELGSK